MVRVKDIIDALEEFAPAPLQESWDNTGLQVGDASMEATGALCTLDVTLDVVHEAKEKGCNVIVSHHPLVFGGLKSITGRNDVERCVIEAIKNDIAIYSCHTSIDNVELGVSGVMADRLGLQNCKILSPQSQRLLKLAVFVPKIHLTTVREALCKAGAGHIGNYDSCSFSSAGSGTFRALDGAAPFVGELDQLHDEAEMKLEVVLPDFLQAKVVSAMLEAHPYEEVAYDIYSIQNKWNAVGLGAIGDLETPVDEKEFLQQIKHAFGVEVVRHSPLLNKKIKRVAVMGGSGASYMKDAMAQGADIFITGDAKYHDFFAPEGRIVLADIGHYESEQYTKELFVEIITKKMPIFAARISAQNTNNVKYC